MMNYYKINLKQKMKMNQKFKVGQWSNYYIPVQKDILFSKDLLRVHLNKFWKEVILTIDPNINILLLFRIQWDNGQFATLGNLQKLNIEDKDYLLDYLLNYLEIKSSSYTEIPIKALTFSYGIRKGRATDKTIENMNPIKYQTYQHYKIPITIDPLEYGKLLHKVNNLYFTNITNLKHLTDKLNYLMKNMFKLNRKNLLISPIPLIANLQNLFGNIENDEVINVNNQQLVAYNTVPDPVVSNLEKVCQELSKETTTFEEAFPNYEPTIDYIPVKIVKSIGSYVKSLSSDYIKNVLSSCINEEIQKNLLSKDTILETKIPSNLIDQMKKVYSDMGGVRPLGGVGDLTINELVSKMYELDLSSYNFDIHVSPLSLISAGLIYKLVVNTFAKQAYPTSTLTTFVGDLKRRDEFVMQRGKNIKIFMLFYAPIITYGIFWGCNHSILDVFKFTNKENNSQIAENILSLLFIIKKNNRHMSSQASPASNNRNNRPNYIKYILIFLLFIIGVGFSNILEIVNNITFIKVLYVYIIVGFIYLIYLFIDLYVFILFLRGKIKIPYYLPTFLSEWLYKKERISQYNPNEVRAFMDLYLRNIIAHIISLLILIIFYIYS